MGIVGGNAVWRRFIVNQMPEWLKWLKSVHLPSHLRLWTKYLDATSPKNAYSRMKRVAGEDEELKLTSNSGISKLISSIPMSCAFNSETEPIDHSESVS